MTRDMTEGRPFRQILIFMIPIVIENLFQQFYVLVDTVIISKLLGVEALAAIGALVGYNFMATGFSRGLTVGFNALISQRFGAKDQEGMKKTYMNSLLLSILVSILVAVIFSALSMPLLRLINTPENIIDDANAYISIIYACIICPTMYAFLAGVLRSMGDSRTPLLFMIIASFLNIILDYSSIRYFGWGIKGAAVATVFSQGASALMCLFYLRSRFKVFRIKAREWKLEASQVKRLLSIGLPSAFMYSITAIGVIIIEASLNRFGSDGVAAYSVSIKVHDLVAQVYPALGVAISTYAAQNLGARKVHRLKDGFRSAMTINICYSAFAFVFMRSMANTLAVTFIGNGSPRVVELASLYMRTSCCFMFFLGLIFIYRNGSQGLGSGKIPMASAFIELTARSITAFTFPLVFGFQGIPLSDVSAWTLSGITLPFLNARLRKKLDTETNVTEP